MVPTEILEGSEGLGLESTQDCWNIVKVFMRFLVFWEFILGFVDVGLWGTVWKRQFIVTSKSCYILLQIGRLGFWWYWLSFFLQSRFLVWTQLLISLQSYRNFLLIFLFFLSSVIVGIVIHFILPKRYPIVDALLLLAVCLSMIFDCSIDNVGNVFRAWRGLSVIEVHHWIVVAILISSVNKVNGRCRFCMFEFFISLISLQK